jgi:hypothetical protein
MLYRYRGEGAAAIGSRAVDIPGNLAAVKSRKSGLDILPRHGMALECAAPN